MSQPVSSLPEGVLLAWYGDDFTGAAAVMEVLTLAGLPSVLFLEIPTSALLAKFSHCRGLGLAGVSRSKSPQWMEAHLPGIFATLSRWGAPIVHYKICSTLDSAPHVGSIGKAIELALRQFEQSWVPVLTAAPAIQRYQLFGNLFAASLERIYRLDRHPTMSRHPVTPMAEADVRVHLAQQTRCRIGLVDYAALEGGRFEQALREELQAGCDLIAIDAVDERSLAAAGELIWSHRAKELFVVGSQGVEYALLAHWKASGVSFESPSVGPAAAVDRIAVVCGSCSPVTAGQIEWARAHGFQLIRIDARRAVDARSWEQAIGQATDEAVRAIDEARDPLVYSACGPDDPAVGAVFEAIEASGLDSGLVNRNIGMGLGRILDSIFRRTRVRRGVLAGGDTSGYGSRALGIKALTLSAPIVPGAALFRAHSEDPLHNTLEIALKGGQMGPADFFGQVKHGGAAAHR